MNIGYLIHNIRIEKGFTKRKLVEGICSEKYIYLIEKGERNPSIQIIRALSVRLKVSILDYLKYSECEKPIRVSNLLGRLANHACEYNLSGIQVLIDELSSLEDSTQPLIQFEIFYYQVFLKVIQQVDKSEILRLISNKYHIDLTDMKVVDAKCGLTERIRVNNLIAIALMNNDEEEKGASVLTSIYTEICNNKDVLDPDMYIRLCLNYCRGLIHIKEYHLAQKVIKDLICHQNDVMLTDKIGLSYYYLSQVFFHQADMDEALACFRKYIISGLALSQPAFFCQSIHVPFSKEIIDTLKQEFDFDTIIRIAEEQVSMDENYE